MTIEAEYAKLLENFNLEYANVLKKFLQVSKSRVVDSKVLNVLKIHYSSVIDSVRTSGYINTLEDLLRVLEKRDELSYENITPLVYIESRYVRDAQLSGLLSDYEKSVVARRVVPLFNVYELPSATPYRSESRCSGLGASKARRLPGHRIRTRMIWNTVVEPRCHLTLPSSTRINTNECNSDVGNTGVARTVFLEVSNSIGRYWRDVARFLDLTENDIDEIDYHSQFSLKEKAFQALLKFQSKCDPSELKSRLQRALEKARRRDLTEMVEELWSLEQ